MTHDEPEIITQDDIITAAEDLMDLNDIHTFKDAAIALMMRFVDLIELKTIITLSVITAFIYMVIAGNTIPELFERVIEIVLFSYFTRQVATGKK